jgi:hypothetical protein
MSPLAHSRISKSAEPPHETAKAKAAYQGFRTLWKDADPDVSLRIISQHLTSGYGNLGP